jgi:cytoplasmic tRNA 2-thiolation protein 1
VHPEAKVRKIPLVQQDYARFTLGFPMLTDSTVLAYVMKTLNERYQYGLELFLLSIDEGITGYRDDSLEVGRSYLFGYKNRLVVLTL